MHKFRMSFAGAGKVEHIYRERAVAGHHDVCTFKQLLKSIALGRNGHIQGQKASAGRKEGVPDERSPRLPKEWMQVAEIYSLPRMTVARQLGMKAGFALDLTTKDEEGN